MITAVRLWDFPAVDRLQREVFPKDAYPWLDLALLLALPGMVNLKATTPEGQVRGFISGTRAWLPGRPAWIVMLGVAPAAQQQGWGGRLLAACEAQLGPGRVRLTVRKSNQAAIKLYEKSAYQWVATRQGYYLDGEDGLVMEKQR